MICVDKQIEAGSTGLSSKSSTTDKLQELQSLKDKGLITEAEYQAKKKQILDSM